MSDNQIIETFLSNQNLQQHYKFVSQEVRKKTGVNIDRYPGMERQFQKMALVLANKKKSLQPHLSELNSDLQNHSTNFFCQQLQKKIQAQNNINNNNVSLNTENTMHLVKDYNKERDARMLSLNESSIDNKQYDPQTLIQSRTDANREDNTDLTKVLENALLERGQINGIEKNSLPNGEEPNILPFNLNDDISNMLSIAEPGQDLPLYQNVLDLTSDNNDPNSKVDKLIQERANTLKQNETLESSTQILDYKKLDRNSQLNLASKFTTKKGESSVMLDRNNTDAMTLNQRSEIKDAAELYRLNEAGKKRMIDRMTNSSISGNDVRSLAPLVDNLLIEKLVSLQRDMQPDYIEKVNYIIVNSIDRDWYKENETRYNFKVNFRPNSAYLGAGIQDLYRNVTSVELVNSILPQDNVLIPFDARLYLDILHFPYLLLQIPEFSDVFRGTNNNNDRTFSVLVFDKQNDSSVLSSEFINDTTNSIVNSSPKSQFYKEYRKTFYKYTPAYFERKTFYNQPLASLGHMTINLATPAGEKINVLSDVLTINDIQFTDTLDNLESSESSNFEYDVTHAYPGTAMSDYRYIRIETATAFSNKLFRLGDNIRIKGYTISGSGTKNNEFVEFINRIEGHYILNTDITDLSNTDNSNQGFTSNIYIAPPGVLNATLTGLESGSYYDDSSSGVLDLNDYSNNSNVAKLINGNLQTHFLFKINTREGDVARVTMPMNV